jgi:hypothetical protein
MSLRRADRLGRDRWAWAVGEAVLQLQARGGAGASDSARRVAPRKQREATDVQHEATLAGVRASAVGHAARLLGRMSGGGCGLLSSRHRPGRMHARTGECGSSARACACVCAACCGIDRACMCDCVCECMWCVRGRGGGGARGGRRWACQRWHGRAAPQRPPHARSTRTPQHHPHNTSHQTHATQSHLAHAPYPSPRTFALPASSPQRPPPPLFTRASLGMVRTSTGS